MMDKLERICHLTTEYKGSLLSVVDIDKCIIFMIIYDHVFFSRELMGKSTVWNAVSDTSTQHMSVDCHHCEAQ